MQLQSGKLSWLQTTLQPDSLRAADLLDTFLIEAVKHQTVSHPPIPKPPSVSCGHAGTSPAQGSRGKARRDVGLGVGVRFGREGVERLFCFTPQGSDLPQQVEDSPRHRHRGKNRPMVSIQAVHVAGRRRLNLNAPYSTAPRCTTVPLQR